MIEAALTDAGPFAVAGFYLGFIAAACAGVPLPASLSLLLGGALAAAGATPAVAVALPALAGALAGDAAGFALGRRSAPLLARLARGPRAGALLTVAQARLRQGARPAVFLSRWLLTPLGPWINLAAGASGLGLAGLWPVLLVGRAIWVAGYAGTGWVFADRLEEAGATLGQMVTGLTGLAVALLALRLAVTRWRQRRAAVSLASQSRKATSGG